MTLASPSDQLPWLRLRLRRDAVRWRARVGRLRMRQIFFGIVGAILLFLGGATVGTLGGPDRVTFGPEAGFDSQFGAGLAGEAIGMLAGLVLGLRWGATRQSNRSGRTWRWQERGGAVARSAASRRHAQRRGRRPHYGRACETYPASRGLRGADGGMRQR